ncbi:hypothetical protein COEREDRAFT_18047 [Coemansia reversa NRRL 1564]|uniref:Protein kinase domain-containing protein n=1 Tax=Coemansia reversa (strain ATCC 12441 / NRRL 1564) TaxID=763665 RepID=A0A2G5B0D0_COERN|nr:hypothetical protein COEREDRAFT_18047 [Coemansia reversa NRRL 1564]|eukprot:PIA12488.1 hypothetical protein COEREDRAFT_18047 [Coemansia reversa NRRL 1564]
MPGFSKGVFRNTKTGKKTPGSENNLMALFNLAVNNMTCANFDAYPLAQPTTIYEYEDHQSIPIKGTDMKPDGVFYYSNARKSANSIHFIVEAKIGSYTNELPSIILGEMAQYAGLVWRDQPTRVFVPVLFVHGPNLDLFLFSRSGYYRVELGVFLHEFVAVSAFTSALLTTRTSAIDVSYCLRNLWFFLHLPPHRFGHFVDVTNGYEFLLFAGAAGTANVKVATAEDHDMSVKLGSRIKRNVPIHRRAAFLLKGTLQDKAVVIKFSWTPTDRLPEGAVYEVLSRGKVEGIPQIYSSGILIKDFLGYRLEYLVMEDCGESIGEYFMRCGEKPSNAEHLYKCASAAIKQTATSLILAQKAGVLHRDISAGNIAIRDGKVTVIDWGYAKILHKVPNQFTGIASKWGFDPDNVQSVEKMHDGITGTPLFMGIRVLRCLLTRSLMDDMESLFYAILFALSYLSNGPDGCPGFELRENNTAAFSKIGLVSNHQMYLGFFGVKSCPDDIAAQLDALYSLLFCSNGQFIGGELLREDRDIRSWDMGIIREILGDELHKRLYVPSIDSTDTMPKHLKRKYESVSSGKSLLETQSKKRKPTRNKENKAPTADARMLRPRKGVKYTK